MIDFDESHLSQIQTQWTLVVRSKATDSEAGAIARAELAGRYAVAIRTYLARLLGSAADADDQSAEVAVKILSGKLAGVDPSKGRFRDYLKTVVINTARSFLQTRRPEILPDASGLLEQLAVEESSPDIWDECIRQDLLQQAMQSLREYEHSSGKPYASILDWRVSDSHGGSQELAAFVFERTGSQVSSVNARKLLQRAREKLAELIVERVRTLLPDRSQSFEDIQQYLIDVGLWEFCRLSISAADGNAR